MKNLFLAVGICVLGLPVNAQGYNGSTFSGVVNGLMNSSSASNAAEISNMGHMSPEETFAANETSWHIHTKKSKKPKIVHLSDGSIIINGKEYSPVKDEKVNSVTYNKNGTHTSCIKLDDSDPLRYPIPEPDISPSSSPNNQLH
jgi:hypothetical protein